MFSAVLFMAIAAPAHDADAAAALALASCRKAPKAAQARKSFVCPNCPNACGCEATGVCDCGVAVKQAEPETIYASVGVGDVEGNPWRWDDVRQCHWRWSGSEYVAPSTQAFPMYTAPRFSSGFYSGGSCAGGNCGSR